MCPLLEPVLIGFFSFIFAAAVNSTHEAKKVAVHDVKKSILLRCLCYGLILKFLRH
jgi:hypothetical protein